MRYMDEKEKKIKELEEKYSNPHNLRVRTRSFLYRNVGGEKKKYAIVTDGEPVSDFHIDAFVSATYEEFVRTFERDLKLKAGDQIKFETGIREFREGELDELIEKKKADGKKNYEME